MSIFGKILNKELWEEVILKPRRAKYLTVHTE
jgi:hypothetical protein